MAIQYVSPYAPIQADCLPFLSDNVDFIGRVVHAQAMRVLREHGKRIAECSRMSDMLSAISSSEHVIVCHTGAWDKVSRYPFLVPFIDGQRVFLCHRKYLGKLSTKFFKVLSEHI